MAGSIRGFVLSCKERKSDVVTTHCFIHRAVLVSKTLGDEMKKVLDNAKKLLTL
jgi:hypothetical protein